MPIQRVRSTYHSMRRLKEISGVFIRHGFADVFSRIGLFKRLKISKSDNPEEEKFSLAERARIAFDELGPTFIKLGQLLSLQPDIIPADFIEEFKKLQDSVSPFPYEDVAEIMEFELGEPVETLFKSFEKEPVAAASVSQVHIAELKSGEKVAVKVQRPGIEAIIREDIKILYKISRMLVKNFKNLDLLNPVGIVSEFEGFIFKELDFAVEGSSIEKFRINFKNDPDTAIPKVYWDLSTSKILVMEHFEGCPTDDLESILAMGLDPKRIARIGLESFAKQVMEHGFYHADPHPGNAIVMADGRIGLIDFGITGFMDNELRRNMANVVVGYSEHDYDRLINIFRNMGIVNETTDVKSFKRDLIELSEPYYGRDLEHLSVKEIFDKVCKLAIKHRTRLPRDLILLFKSLTAGENMGRVLTADVSVLEVMKPYALKFLEQAHDPKTIFGNLRHDMFTYGNIAKNLPETLNTILQNISLGKLKINLGISGLENFSQDLSHALTRLTFGLLIGASLLAAPPVLNSRVGIYDVPLTWFGIDRTIPITHILGFLGYGIATALGLWLVVSLFRGGKVTKH